MNKFYLLYVVTVLLEMNDKDIYDLVQYLFAICFAECGGLLSGFSGTIASLWDTPDLISEERCAWEINTPGGKSLYLRSNENFAHPCNDSIKVYIMQNMASLSINFWFKEKERKLIIHVYLEPNPNFHPISKRNSLCTVMRHLNICWLGFIDRHVSETCMEEENIVLYCILIYQSKSKLVFTL